MEFVNEGVVGELEEFHFRAEISLLEENLFSLEDFMLGLFLFSENFQKELAIRFSILISLDSNIWSWLLERVLLMIQQFSSWLIWCFIWRRDDTHQTNSTIAYIMMFRDLFFLLKEMSDNSHLV